jgi:O-methyltransferase involved in polyketide biosynthesis
VIGSWRAPREQAGECRTAFIIAEFRAEENAAAEPLYRDDVVPLFLDDETRGMALESAATFPAASEMVKVRTWYFDRAVSRAMSEGARQVVILGSGLDTRAARLARKGVRFFEIDDGRTLRLKRARLAAAGLRPHVAWIPGDYLADDLIDRLRAAGCDPAFLRSREGNDLPSPRRYGARLPGAPQPFGFLDHVRRSRMSGTRISPAWIISPT